MNKSSFKSYEVTYNMHKSITTRINVPYFISKSVDIDELLEYALRSRQINFSKVFNNDDADAYEYITSNPLLISPEEEEEDMIIVSEFDFDGSPKNINFISFAELRKKDQPTESQDNTDNTDNTDN